MLTEMGLLKKEDHPYLEKYISFVTDCDNAAFTEDEAKKIYANYTRNPYGMKNRLTAEQILEFFEKGGDPIKGFSRDYLKNHKYYNPGSKAPDKMDTLEQLGQYIHGKKKETEKNIRQMENQGFVIDTGKDRFGKILIDTKRLKNSNGGSYPKVPSDVGHLGVRAAGYGGYLIWSPQENSFVIFTTVPMKEDLLPGGFPDGRNIRGNMWMKPPYDPKPLSLNLEQILAKLTGKDDFKIEGKLKESLEKEENARAVAEARLQKATPVASQIPVQPPTPDQAPAVLAVEIDEKQEKISDSVKKMASLFSNFELSYEAIIEESKAIGVDPLGLAIGFIESNKELDAQFKAKAGSVSGKDKEKLALTIILKEGQKKTGEEIDKKNKELEGLTDDRQIAQINLEKEKLEDKRARLGVGYIRLARGIPSTV
jgi:hypothetical protein